MISFHRDDTWLDDLLKEALADDLPPAVEAGMRERIETFRAETASGGKPGEKARPRWRMVWAAASVLMLAAGSLLQIRRSGSPLAERVAAVMTGLADLDSARRSGAGTRLRLIEPERRQPPIPKDKENER